MQTEPSLKKSSSTNIPISPTKNEPNERIEALPSSNSEVPDDRLHNIQEHSIRINLKDLLFLRKSDEPQIFEPKIDEINNPFETVQEPRSFSVSYFTSSILQIKDSYAIAEEEQENSKQNIKQQSIDVEEFMPKFCIACKIDQPVRAKHCVACQKCVHNYDHHCTWLGNCIGELNHCFYYFYLIFQSLELIFGLVLILLSLTSENYFTLFVILSICLVPTLIFSLFLCVFHTYLIGNGLTTWELISWKRISYLGEKKSSPFSFGFIQNLKFFFSFRKPKDWNKIAIKI